MKKHQIYLPKCHKSFAIVFILLINCFIAQAQKTKKPKNASDLNNTAQTIQSLTNVIVSVKALLAATHMKTADFNKNVTVVKGTPGKTNVYPTDVTRDQFTQPKFKKNKFTNFTWTPISFFDGQLFPSSIICMATYKDTLEGKLEAISRPIGFSIVSEYSNIPLNWEIECVGTKYFKKLSGSVFYKEKKKILELMPPVSWDYGLLSKNLASTPISVTFKIFDQEGNQVEKTETIYLKSINECIYKYIDLDLDFLVTGYIQEEHPEIDKILKEAINTKMVKHFTGYQKGKSEEAVNMQVAAIWRALHDRGFTYSSIAQTVGATENIKSQTIRTFDNSIKTSQANCVDGSIVFASILRRIGISTVLVLTSDHCFLGYYTDPEKKNIYYIETTMLSEADLIDNAKTKEAKNKAYREQFDNARKYASKEYDKYTAKNDILEIDVDMMRKLVKPIPFYVN